MTPATLRSIVAVLFAALAVEGKVNDRFWGFLDDLAGDDGSDATTVEDMFDRGAGMQVEDCGNSTDVMHVARTEFDRSRLQVRAYGNLKHNVSGGNVSVKMFRGRAAGNSSKGRWKNVLVHLAWHSVPHKYEEDLCKHFNKSHSQRGCPLPAGDTELRFALDKLPPMVVAGAYELQIKAVDASDEQVACVRARVEVPRGKNGELFRRLHDPRALTDTGDMQMVTGSAWSQTVTILSWSLALLW